MKAEFEGKQEMLIKDWLGDECNLFRSCNWWKSIIGTHENIEFVDVWEMSNVELAWSEWLKQDHDFSKNDSAFYYSIIKKYTTFVAIAVKIKAE